MTLYLTFHSFEASSDLSLLEHNKYWLELFIQKEHRKTYEMNAERIRYFEFQAPQAHSIALLINQQNIEIRLLGGNSLNNLQLIDILELTKEKLIQDNELTQKNNQPITSHYLFQLHKHKLNLVLKLNPYKRIIYNLTNNSQPLSSLSLLEQDSFAQNHTIVIPQQHQSKPISRIHQDLYVGPCPTKNLFSFLDPKVKSQFYSIVQPSYQ